MASSILFAATGGLFGGQCIDSACVWPTSIRDENGRCGGSCLLHGVGYARKDGLAEMLRAGLLGVCASDDICACVLVSMPFLRYRGYFVRGRIPYSIACCAWKLSPINHRPVFRGRACTHVPCLPVKPWNSTFVSPLMRRFLMVSAYCEELVAYCRVADRDSAERRGYRRACIVTVGCHEGWGGLCRRCRGVQSFVELVWAHRKLRHQMAGLLRLPLGQSGISVRARQLHENTSFIYPLPSTQGLSRR